MEHDLSGLLDEEQVHLSESQVKFYMFELLRALAFLHQQKILHRDIKGSNVLISNAGDVKLADFGLARPLHQPFDPARHKAPGGGDSKEERVWKRDLTNRVVTLWYRAPELLLGSTQYSDKIDIWAAGCIFAELLSGGQALFPGHSEFQQLENIYRLCGSPTEHVWRGVSRLPWFDMYQSRGSSFPRVVKQTFADRFSPQAVDLLDRFLALDPALRPSAEEALQHPYFHQEEPLMLSKERHPEYPGHHHEYETKQRNKARAKRAGAESSPSDRPLKRSKQPRSDAEDAVPIAVRSSSSATAPPGPGSGPGHDPGAFPDHAPGPVPVRASLPGPGPRTAPGPGVGSGVGSGVGPGPSPGALGVPSGMPANYCPLPQRYPPFQGGHAMAVPAPSVFLRGTGPPVTIPIGYYPPHGFYQQLHQPRFG